MQRSGIGEDIPKGVDEALVDSEGKGVNIPKGVDEALIVSEDIGVNIPKAVDKALLVSEGIGVNIPKGVDEALVVSEGIGLVQAHLIASSTCASKPLYPPALVRHLGHHSETTSGHDTSS